MRARYAARAFVGEGARLMGGRWNSPGQSVVYLSEHRSLAMFEVFVNTEPVALRHEHVIVGAEWESTLTERIEADELLADWIAFPAGPTTMAIGDRWLREARSAVLAVPSVVIPEETNYLINPAHRDFRRIKIGKPAAFIFDKRLLQS